MDRLLGYRDAEGTNGRAFLLSQERKAARTSDHAEELPSVYLCSFSANANSIETSLGLLSFYGEDQITPLSAVLNYLPRRNVMSHYRKFPRVEIYRREFWLLSGRKGLRGGRKLAVFWRNAQADACGSKEV